MNNRLTTISAAALFAATTAAFPIALRATDIAWSSKGEPAVWQNTNFERRGTIELNGVEKGTFVQYGTNLRDVDGMTPWITQYVFRFDDLSSIVVRVAGKYDPATQLSKGAGEILGGTGRFDGIKGTVNTAGKFAYSGGAAVVTDWTGSYSLPAK